MYIKTITSIFIITAFSSCVKNYSCECTTTLSAQYYMPYDKKTIVPIEKKTSKKKAQAYCDHTSKQMTASTKQLYSSWVEVSSRCKLIE